MLETYRAFGLCVSAVCIAPEYFMMIFIVKMIFNIPAISHSALISSKRLSVSRSLKG